MIDSEEIISLEVQREFNDIEAYSIFKYLLDFDSYGDWNGFFIDIRVDEDKYSIIAKNRWDLIEDLYYITIDEDKFILKSEDTRIYLHYQYDTIENKLTLSMKINLGFKDNETIGILNSIISNHLSLLFYHINLQRSINLENDHFMSFEYNYKILYGRYD